MYKTRVKYFFLENVTGAALYSAIQSSFGNLSAADPTDLLAQVEFEAPGKSDLTFQRLPNYEESLGNFVLQAQIDDLLHFSLVRRQRSVTFRTECDDDKVAVRFRDKLIQQLVLQEATAIGVSLSGGGFRATLFHLGVIRLLREANYLSQVTHVFAVSGGSIMAAHLVLNWSRYLGTEDEFEAATKELIAFIQADLRGKIVRRWLLGWLLFWVPFLRRKLLNRISLLQRFYGKLFKIEQTSERKTRPAELKDLNAKYENFPDPPEIYLLATAMRRGELCAFSNQGFSYEDPPCEAETFEANNLRVASAVAASSAFPPLFPPLSTRKLGLTGNEINALADDYLSDGGVFDNLGTRKFLWMRQQVNHELKFFLVSDAGAPFDWKEGQFNNVLSRTIRATDILMRRVGDLEFESANRNEPAFQTNWIRCYIHQRFTEDGALSEHSANDQKVQQLVARVRTDLDRFNTSEIRSLVWHGFFVARQAFTEALSGVERARFREKTSGYWDPLPQCKQEDVSTVRENLERSSHRSVGWVSWLLDWATYALVGIPLLVVSVFAYAAYAGYASGVHHDLKDEQLRRSSRDVVRNFEQLERLAREPATSQFFTFTIEYFPWSELERQLKEKGFSGPRYEPIIERIKNVEGQTTPAVSVRVSEREEAFSESVSWTGVIKRLEIPSKGKIIPKIDLTFVGKSDGRDAMKITFTQSYSGEDTQGDTTVPAQAPNSFQVRVTRDKDGVYSGSVPHPDLNNMIIGRVIFRPF